jgi:hypothetical protein
MWSARHGHAVVVLYEPVARSYKTEEENSELLRNAKPVLLLLGGDDGLPRASESVGYGYGKLRNDIWLVKLSTSDLSSWRIDDDRYFLEGSSYNPERIRPEMQWREVNPGRVVPATWPAGPKYSLPLTNDEWIACQDSIKDRLDYSLALPDPSICDEPPQFCYDDMNAPGCHLQAMWKIDNMWSPRRGLGAVNANDKIFVIGGESRDYARIDDARLIGGLAGQKRIITVNDHSTIQEDLVLKNDIWSSQDEGVTWQLVNPGCKDPQEDVLMNTEVWSTDHSDPSQPRFVGSMGSKCVTSSDCWGVAECKALGNTPQRVCVCPMFSPRTNHAVTVQHRFSIADDGSVFAEDVIYVIGGFINVKQAFCSNRSCGPTDGYRLAIDDAWMSTDGVRWTQIKSAFDKNSKFHGRGRHTAMVVHSQSSNASIADRLFIFGGETFHPQGTLTSYLNDVWKVDLPKDPCCNPTSGCLDDVQVLNNDSCVPSQSDWSIVTPNAEWSERSGHVTVYEPPSSKNSFRDRIYLIGGKNADSELPDVWTWNLRDGAGWQCDFCSNDYRINATSARETFLSVDSPLAEVKRFRLPPSDADGNLINPTSRLASPIVSRNDISVIASEGVITVADLAYADLYKVVKLRGFDYPGRHAPEVTNICFLRALSIAIVDKCTVNDKFHQPMNEMVPPPPSTICGRGGISKPCVRGDWDGCTPIPGATKVDVHGLGYVSVPQILHDPASLMEEIFCRQTPGERYSGAAAFLDTQVVLLGGIGNNSSRLYRDMWSRDESFPQAIIVTKPMSGSSQSQFYFDSNEVGVHVFEYKLVRDDLDLIPWTATTKSLGANVGWLDDKVGGPGSGWYTLYVRAVEPSGNRDVVFSNLTNSYRWNYIPSVNWVTLSGSTIGIISLVSAAVYEYRRLRRKHILQRFQLRRLKRKFKLRGNTDGVMHGKTSEASNSSRSHSHGSTRNKRRGDPRGSRDEAKSTSNSKHSSHRSESKSESLSIRRRRRKKNGSTTEDEPEDESRARRRRDREKVRRDLLKL